MVGSLNKHNEPVCIRYFVTVYKYDLSFKFNVFLSDALLF